MTHSLGDCERCVGCGALTGRVGPSGDVLYCQDCHDGPFCEDCFSYHPDECKGWEWGFRQGHVTAAGATLGAFTKKG